MSEVRRTQRERILQLLRSHEGQWVSLQAILDLRIGQYNTRIKELRAELRPEALEIENRTARDDSGSVLSWYRLVSSAGPEIPKPEPPKPSVAWQDRKPATGLPLWDGTQGWPA
jgi:hypothetical protein